MDCFDHALSFFAELGASPQILESFVDSFLWACVCTCEGERDRERDSLHMPYVLMGR